MKGIVKNRKLILKIEKEFDLNYSLDLGGTGITSLPENLKVGGSLYLEGTGITSLPENLKVGGSLYLRGTKINKKNIPKNLIKQCIF